MEGDGNDTDLKRFAYKICGVSERVGEGGRERVSDWYD